MDAQASFIKIRGWEKKNAEAPENIPRTNSKEKDQTQILVSS